MEVYMNEVIIRDPNLAYLLGLSGGNLGNPDLKFFEFTQNLDDLKKFGRGKDYPFSNRLQPYSVSQRRTEYGGFETSHFLSELIEEAIHIEYSNKFPYNKKIINTITEKKNYNNMKERLIEEIRRIYQETQSYLAKEFPEGEIRLVRCLSQREMEEEKRGKIKFNYISSWQPVNHEVLMYPSREKLLQKSIPLRKIFAYTNLSNGITNLLQLENEVIVINA